MWGAVEIAQAQKKGGGKFGLPVVDCKVSHSKAVAGVSHTRVPGLLFVAGGGSLPAMGLLPRVGFDHSPLDDLLPPEPLCERAVGPVGLQKLLLG